MTTYRIAVRRDLASAWLSEDPTLSQGEFGYETDTRRMKIGDGLNAWSLLPYHVGVTGDDDITSGTLATVTNLTVGDSVTVTNNGDFGGNVDANSFGLNSGPLWSAGNGSPEGIAAYPVGSLYSQLDAANFDALWVKESGASGPTGWRKASTTVVTRASGTKGTV